MAKYLSQAMRREIFVLTVGTFCGAFAFGTYSLTAAKQHENLQIESLQRQANGDADAAALAECRLALSESAAAARHCPKQQ